VTEEQDLLRSAAIARDVIESYRQSHITVSGWSALLEEAAKSFARLSEHPKGAAPLAQIAETLSATVQASLKVDQDTLDWLSSELRTIVTSTRVPGIPRPEDDDWSF
jgi:hypothetical protein